jgi:dipeptidase
MVLLFLLLLGTLTTAGKSAVWVAKRVPDGHVCAVANQFIIKNSWDLGSDNVVAVAKRAGLWDESKQGPLHFAKVRRIE